MTMKDSGRGGRRYSINFDLKQNALKEFYNLFFPENAYHKLRIFMGKHGFEHIQGSGYNSISRMTDADIINLMFDLKECFPWLVQAVRVIQATEIGEYYDYTDVIKNTDEESIYPLAKYEKDILETNLSLLE